jgi:hypothetical protein
MREDFSMNAQEQTLADYFGGDLSVSRAASEIIKRYQADHNIASFRDAAYELQRHFKSYRSAKTYSQAREVTIQERKAAENVVRSYQEDLIAKGFDPREALRRAVRIEPEWGAKYLGVREVVPLSREVAYSKDLKEPVLDPLARMMEKVTRGKNADGSIDWPAALIAVKGDTDLIRKAASNEIDRRALIEQARVAQPGFTSAALPSAMKTVRVKFPGLSRAADSGHLDQETLKLLCWSKRQD